MTFKYKKLLPVGILIVFIVVAWVVKNNPPTTKRARPSQAPQLTVDVQEIKRQDFAINIDSYGMVRPRTQSMLLPQVSGQIMSISPKFRDGGFFEKGDVLVELDDRDYRAEIKIAQASLYSAKQALSEEEARVKQAEQDWQRLGNGDTAPELVLRKPQLTAAQANVYSAEATLAKAKLSLERTKIKAPYTGRILKKEVDVGQVVSTGTQLAEIYAVDYVEIRLPIKNKDLPFMLLPEANRFEQESAKSQSLVAFSSDLTARQSWLGKVVRTEGAFDENSQQLYVVAQIDDPYGVNASNIMPLKIGQYLTAKIKGKGVKNTLVIPNKAIYQGSYIYLVKDKALQRQDINIAWQNAEVAMISSGVEEGDLLVLTPLGQVNSGTPVAISSDPNRTKAKRGSKPSLSDRASKQKEQN